jgi:TonB-linked SusC/RagA family outer membrane protein
MKKRLLKLTLLMMLFSVSVYAQKVTGKVTSGADGSPLPGVSVLLKGTSTGGATDGDGAYALDVADAANGTLVFSFIGFVTQEVPIQGRTTVDVSMNEDAAQLTDVVVTAFGIEREKKSLTYSAQTVSTQEISQARALNVVNSLSGKVAGLSIAPSGNGVGSASRVLLRGNRSIDRDSQPLYIIDGVPLLGDLTNINPDDIASISVLKGPNAAALYGNRANNGVIIITTKTGKSTKGFDITLSSTYTVEAPIHLKNFQNEYGQGSTGVYGASLEDSWGPKMTGSPVAFWSPNPNSGITTLPYTAQPDNVKDFYQNGHNSATNLAISAGTEKSQTYFSYTFTDATGNIPGNALQRHNIHLRVTNKLLEKLTLDSKINYIRDDLDNQLATGEDFTNPNRHALRLPRNIRTQDAEIFEYVNAAKAVRQNYWNPGSNGGANPYWTINRNLRKNTTDRIIAFTALKYQLLKDLTIQGRSSIDRSFSDATAKIYNDTYIVADNGRYSLAYFQQFDWNSDFLAIYDKSLSEELKLNLTAGGNVRINRSAGLQSNTGQALTLPNLFGLSNTQLASTSENILTKMNEQSLFGSAQIGFKNAIFLDLTGRNDWSSTLPAANRSFFYPSAGLNAVISDLITLPKVFTFIKARVSYAEVGNATVPYRLDRVASLTAGGNNGYIQLSTTIPNRDLRPERTKSLEFGADFRFLENKIGLDFTYYKSNTLDQLFAVALPVGSGASFAFVNGGDVQNKGLELMLSGTPVKTASLAWDIEVNFTRNRSEVLKINDERPSLTLGQDFLREFRVIQGKPWGEVYSRGFARDAQGRVIILADGTPRITDGFSVRVANFNPDWLGGIRNTLTYKNFNLSFLIDIRQGGSVTSLTNAILYANGLTEETLTGRDGTLIFGRNIYSNEVAVKEDGTPNDIAMPAERFWQKVGGRNAPVGEVFSKDASNGRLRELVLGYSLPTSLLGKSPFSSVSFSVVGRNLFFLYNKAGDLDPEIMVGTGKTAEGFESFAPPTTRSVGFNVRLGF